MATVKKQPAAPRGFARRALAPIGSFNEMLFGNVKRTARLQYDLAGQYLQFPLDLMQAAVESRDLKTILATQFTVTKNFVEQGRERRRALREQPFARPLLGPPVGDPHGFGLQSSSP